MIGAMNSKWNFHQAIFQKLKFFTKKKVRFLYKNIWEIGGSPIPNICKNRKFYLFTQNPIGNYYKTKGSFIPKKIQSKFNLLYSDGKASVWPKPGSRLEKRHITKMKKFGGGSVMV